MFRHSRAVRWLGAMLLLFGLPLVLSPAHGSVPRKILIEEFSATW